MKTPQTYRISEETLKNIEGLRALKVGKSDADVIEKAVKFFLEAQNDSQRKVKEFYELICKQISLFENMRDFGRDVRVEETMSIMPDDQNTGFLTEAENEYLETLYKSFELIKENKLFKGIESFKMPD